MGLATTMRRRGGPLADAVAHWTANDYDALNDWLRDQSGNALHLRLGSTTGADTADPYRAVFEGTRYAYFPGNTENYLSAPDSAAVSITGDLGLVVQVTLDDYTPLGQWSFIGKWLGITVSYRFTILPSGLLRLEISSTGSSATTTVDSTVTLASAISGLTDAATKLWLWARLDVDNGALGHNVAFMYSLAEAHGAAGAADWVSIGDTVTTAGTTSIADTAAALNVAASGNGAAATMAGKVYQAKIYASNNLTDLRFHADLRNVAPGATSFTESSANAATVTINRAATGGKTMIVEATKLLCRSDDFMEAVDSALLDFAADESFTVAVAMRAWGTPSATTTYLAKKAGSGTSVGYRLFHTSANNAGIEIGDGAATALANGSMASESGAGILLAGVRDVAADALTASVDGTATAPTTDTTTVTLANAEVLRIARLSGAGTAYADLEFYRAAVWRRALNAAELQTVANEWAVAA